MPSTPTETSPSADPPPGYSADGIPQAGTLIAGKFRVEKLLGKGGMGFVVAARHMTLGEQVAIKFLIPKVAANAEAVARFLREARAAVRIKSEHVVRVSDVGTLETGQPYMVMEHLEGSDLDQLLEREGQLPIDEAVGYVLQAACAIAEAHALGIVHRDVKPSNLFLTTRTDGTPLIKVLDFGISKAVANPDRNEIDLTSTQSVFGSPRYMSPEQVRSAKNVDTRTDIWALGVVLYELMTGKSPFEADTVPAVLAKIVADPPTPLRMALPKASRELEDALNLCFEKNVDARYQTLGELAVALAPFGPPGCDEHVERVKRMCKPALASRRSARPAHVGEQDATLLALPQPVPSRPPAAEGGATAPAWTGTNHPKRPTRSALLLAGGAAAVLGAVVAAVVFTSRARPPLASPAAAPYASPAVVLSTVAAVQRSTAAPSAVATAVPSDVATAAPSASAPAPAGKPAALRRPIAEPSPRPSTDPSAKPSGAKFDPTQGRGD